MIHFEKVHFISLTWAGFKKKKATPKKKKKKPEPEYTCLSPITQFKCGVGFPHPDNCTGKGVAQSAAQVCRFVGRK